MLETLKLRKLRRIDEKRFIASNLILYKSITDYIQRSYLSYKDKEEILRQIMDSMLQGQLEDKPVDITIDNYEAFCDTIISKYPSNKNFAYKTLSYIETYLKWFLIFTILSIIPFAILIPHYNFYLTFVSITSAIASSLYVILFRTGKRKLVYKSIFGKIKYKAYKYTNKNPYRMLIFAAFLFIPTFAQEPQFANLQVNFYGTASIIMIPLIIICFIEIYKGILI